MRQDCTHHFRLVAFRRAAIQPLPLDHTAASHPAGDPKGEALRVNFGRQLML